MEETNVGNGFESWNEAIDARVGEIVQTPDGSLELWCDEEGLLTQREYNHAASLLARCRIVGDVIVFKPGDIE
jgi:hypothetical protein